MFIQLYVSQDENTDKPDRKTDVQPVVDRSRNDFPDETSVAVYEKGMNVEWFFRYHYCTTRRHNFPRIPPEFSENETITGKKASKVKLIV